MAAPAQALPANEVRVEKAPGILAEAASRFFRNRLAVGGLIVATFIILCAAFADVIAPYGRDEVSFTEFLQPPSGTHWLGTDEVGRDFLTRIIYGARTSMLVGLSVPLLTTLVGVPIGALAGWSGRRADFIFLRVVEILQAIPFIMVAILLVTLSKEPPGIEQLVLYFSAIGWIGAARFTRAQFISLKHRDYVLAARAVGATDRRMMFQHILPNAAGPIIVGLMTGIPGAVFGEAGLSFLGLGIQDPIPSWGKMISRGGAQYLQSVPLLVLVPSAMIALTMLAFTFVGDGLRDALDPYMQR